MNINDIKNYSVWLKGKIDFTNHHKAYITLLVCIAKEFGKPLTFTSSFRTPKLNIACGGSPTSSHLKGLAFDIKCDNSSDRYKLLYTLFHFGITRIGIYKNFIHIDFDASKPQSVVWYD